MGVIYDKSRNKWQARYRRKYYGRYASQEEAAIVLNKIIAGEPYTPSAFNPLDNLKNGKGKDSAAWRGGKPNCLDCRVKLSHWSNKRCHPCFYKSISGSNSYMWKGGVTSDNDRERVKFRMSIQKKIFASEFPDLRFELDNCRTLCMACHYYITFKRKLPKGVVWVHNFKQRMTS